MNSTNDLKTSLLLSYASSTLVVRTQDTLDATIKKMLRRMDEIDTETSKLRRERDHLTSALASIGYRPPKAHPTIYAPPESNYGFNKPFQKMSLTDACLKVLKDQSKREASEQWLDKNQVEYLVARGGYEFNTKDATNSVNVTLQRLTGGGFCEAHGGKGSRSKRYRFLKDREPEGKQNDETVNSRATK
jgi:hypothetical protein